MAEAGYLQLRDGLLSLVRSGSGQVVTQVSVAAVRDLIHRVEGSDPHQSDDASRRALLDAADAIEDVDAPDGLDVGAWLRDRAGGDAASATEVWVVDELDIDLPGPPPEGEPHPARTPVGPFPSAGAAIDWADTQVNAHGGGGSFSVAQLIAPGGER